MRVIVVGLGVQGYKRQKFAGSDCVATVDPDNQEAKYKDLEEIPLDAFDAALLCVPDKPKNKLIEYLLNNKKHVLIEKPFWVNDISEIKKLENLAHKSRVYCYTAYNHRFEPHFVRIKKLIESGVLGRLYNCRMFYGNGTAKLVRDSVWRDQGGGVLPDLGSHLLDTIKFWFGTENLKFKNDLINCAENNSPDHVIFSNNNITPKVQCEMTLLSWRNHFTCDLFAEKGSAHIRSLCKWGPSTFTHRTRMIPSGCPPEETVTVVQDDPTWQLEYAYFKQACLSNKKTDLSTDLWLHKCLSSLTADALANGQEILA